MELPQDKADLLARIAHERAVLAGLIGLRTPAQAAQPGADGVLSAQAMLAHIAGWEARCTEWIAADLRGETPAIPAPGATWDDMDRLNAEAIAAWADRTVADVQVAAAATHVAFVAQLVALPAADLTDPQRFPWLGGRPILPLVVACSYEHYEEHAAQLWEA